MAGARLVVVGLLRTLARHELFAVCVTGGLVLEVGGQVILLDCGRFSVEASLNRVGSRRWCSH